MKFAHTERGNARGERNKMASVFTDLLTQKSTHLGQPEIFSKYIRFRADIIYGDSKIAHLSH